MTVYAVPDNPADPESAALELIVRLPAALLDTGLSEEMKNGAQLTLRAGP